MNTKQFGQIAESKFIFECAKRGLTVSQPIGDNAKYDFILDLNKKLIKVQCKTLRKVNHKFCAETHSKTGNRRVNKQSYVGEVDWFYLYNVEEDIGLYIKVDGLSTQTYFIPKNKIKVFNPKTKYLEDYIKFIT